LGCPKAAAHHWRQRVEIDRWTVDAGRFVGE
jgi:hypothetical protein